MSSILKASVVGGSFLMASICPAFAEHAGENEYMVACSGCHGESGKGQGPLADILTLEPPDLTKIAAENDGDFPYLEVFMIVDGRSGVRGHGGAMPIWGDRFKAAALENYGKYGAEVVARGRIATLVDYLVSIQE